MTRVGVPTAADLGLMQGTPSVGGALVTLANWQDPPFNRWGFQHVRDLIPTARIARGDAPARRLPGAERDLSRATVRAAGRSVRLDRFCEETYTDGMLVLHRGRVIHERYENGMTPSTAHLLMSVSKSVTSAVTGILVGRGELSPHDLVTSHIPELEGTSFEGCTVRHLLDMRAGTRFDEDYDNVRGTFGCTSRSTCGVRARPADSRRRSPTTTAPCATRERTADRSTTARSSPTCWGG